jgi:hypothetical protein
MPNLDPTKGNAPTSRRPYFLALERPRSALGDARNPAQLNGNCCQVLRLFDSSALLQYECLDLQNRARETELALCFSVSFVRKRGAPIPRYKSKRALGQMERSNFE